MKKKIIIGIVAVILAIVAVIGYFVVSEVMQEKTLIKEINKIAESDITKDEIDMKIKTKGDYAIVETTIKEYMNTYSTNCKDIINIMNDKKMAEILTADNYKNDGPEFTASKEYINNTRAEFNEKINVLIDMTSEESMNEAIANKNLNEEFLELYNRLMLGDEMKVDLQETVDGLKEANEGINHILDVQEKVINLLIANKEKWSINDDDEIEFETQKLVDQYNELISSL